jgi:CubicO group peptidase (beta-lactamase class C family)
MSFQVRWLRIAVLCASGILGACGDGGGGGPPPLDAPPAPAAGTLGDGRLGELLEWARSSQQVPAMGAIVIRHGAVIERGVVGRRSAAGKAEVTLADQWHLGSITKSMTATLAALLVEDGVIAWDSRPIDVWPELANSVHAAFRNITLRQLLSHTSGMKRDDGWSGADDGGSESVVQKRREWAAHLLAQAPAVSAGQFSYSNVGYVVAGAMLEARAGAAWETLLATRVFAPLGMSHSGFGAPGRQGQEDQPLGHWSTPRGFVPVQPGPNADGWEAVGPAGRVHASLEDFARYLQSHLAGEMGTPGLLSVDSYRTLHTTVAAGYGLGWATHDRLSLLDAGGFSHNGSNLRWFALTWFSPELDTGVLLVANGGGERGNAAITGLDIALRARIHASR